MKTVVISGAGSGIGEATAIRLAREGFDIVLLGRTEAKLRAAKAKLHHADGHEILVADVSSKEALSRAIDEMSARELFAVVANAGVGGDNRYGPDDRWEEVIAINLSGTYYLINECLPRLRKSGESYKHVILISSVLARLGIPQYSAYCASKAGMLGLMRSMAAELARDRILVNAICPGWVETEMARDGIQRYADATGQTYEEAYRQQMAQDLLRKMSQPDEIAALIAFLLSNQQTSMTGQALDINNGSFMAS